ncbi:MAG TPA: lamin tail domain-containing protein, partial [Myxococcales bacterium]|nr:lamin tail domain-containing protein [Myxococcales bacterium]
MKARLSRLVLLALCAQIGLNCSDAPMAPDVMSELPSEIRFRTYSSAATLPEVVIKTPFNFKNVLLPDGKSTVDVELTFESNSCAEVESDTYRVAWYDNGSLIDKKNDCNPIILTLAYGDHNITLQMLDANDSELTNAASRSSRRIQINKKCAGTQDSSSCENDGFFCNGIGCIPQLDADKNTVFVCKFGAPPFGNCCQHEYECAFGQYCNVADNKCVACTADPHCEDSNLCTTDSCFNGVCSNVKQNPLCCDCSVTSNPNYTIEKQCTDGKFCSQKGCNCGTNTCTYTTKTFKQGLCCETGDHASCDDTDACNVDLCVANICRHSPPLGGTTGCCNGDADCLDGNVCTTDSCDLVNNACLHTPVNNALCCNTKSDCNDNKSDTLDNCINFQCVFTADPNYCELPPTSNIVINEIMIDPMASGDGVGEWIELYNSTSQAIDLNFWVVGDKSGQTHDINNGGPLIVAAGGYAVLCRSSDKSVNGGVDCAYSYGSSYLLKNNGGELVIKDSTYKLIDEVGFDGGPNFPNPEGASIALTNPSNNNKVGANWKISNTQLPGNTDKGTPGAKNEDVFSVIEIAKCQEQPTDNICTLDTCVANTCTNVKKPGCCLTTADCIAPTQCHTASCGADKKCTYSQIPAPTCCLTDDVCDDGLTCNVDKCIGFKCRHSPDQTKLGSFCCDTDVDCGNANNSCVTAVCDTDNNVCKPPVVSGGPNCCTEVFASPSTECDDGDPSTLNTCKDFQCKFVPDQNYCDTQPGGVGINNCSLDANKCTNDACDVANKTCLYEAIVGCCKSTADCGDSDPCTLDVCIEFTNTCSNEKAKNCCVKSQETTICNDNDPCTNDSCIGLVPAEGKLKGTCRSVKKDLSCCTTNASCNDKNACTNDTCLGGAVGTAGVCQSTAVVPAANKKCCDPLLQAGAIKAQCDDQNLCTIDNCGGDNLCSYTKVPDNIFGTCCDLSTGVSEAAQCDDANACTLDKCIFGRCRNLDAGTASCCINDSDCPDDGNSCTVEYCDVSNPATGGVCKSNLANPCTVKLPWVEKWTGVSQLDDGIQNHGWELWDNTNATNSSLSNWQLTTKGQLGPDEHMRFNWAPIAKGYDSCLITPRIDSNTWTGASINKIADYLTVQFEDAGGILAPDTEVNVFAYEAPAADTYPPPVYDDIAASSWKWSPLKH